MFGSVIAQDNLAEVRQVGMTVEETVETAGVAGDTVVGLQAGSVDCNTAGNPEGGLMKGTKAGRNQVLNLKVERLEADISTAD